MHFYIFNALFQIFLHFLRTEDHLFIVFGLFIRRPNRLKATFHMLTLLSIFLCYYSYLYFWQFELLQTFFRLNWNQSYLYCWLEYDSFRFLQSTELFVFCFPFFILFYFILIRFFYHFLFIFIFLSILFMNLSYLHPFYFNLLYYTIFHFILFCFLYYVSFHFIIYFLIWYFCNLIFPFLFLFI